MAYTEPGSPAAQAGLGARHCTLIAIDGIDVGQRRQADADRAQRRRWRHRRTGRRTAFSCARPTAAWRTVNLTSASVARRSPVQNVHTLATPTGTVGYLQFNDHVEKAEVQLVEAANQLQAAASPTW